MPERVSDRHVRDREACVKEAGGVRRRDPRGDFLDCDGGALHARDVKGEPDSLKDHRHHVALVSRHKIDD